MRDENFQIWKRRSIAARAICSVHCAEHHRRVNRRDAGETLGTALGCDFETQAWGRRCDGQRSSVRCLSPNSGGSEGGRNWLSSKPPSACLQRHIFRKAVIALTIVCRVFGAHGCNLVLPLILVNIRSDGILLLFSPGKCDTDDMLRSRSMSSKSERIGSARACTSETR